MGIENEDKGFRVMKILGRPGGQPKPPFEPGDIVQITPFRGCHLDPFYCKIDLEVERCERAPVRPEVVWDVELKGCPYLIIYPLPDDYTMTPVDLVRDRTI